jgi:phosphoglycolate phosphatase-like HAD superfamily hydrolase
MYVPPPESIEKILQNFALGKEEVLLVGDAETDRKTALAAGVTFIAYKNREIPACAHMEDHLAILNFV